MTTNTKRHNRSIRYCSPNCQFFRCSKRALGPKQRVRGRLRISCKFVAGDLCTGSRCTYSFCTKHKMLPDGKCGLRERPTVKEDDDKIEQKYERELLNKEKQNSRYQTLLKDKYRKKLKGNKW
ncbi:MAG: hypothetical protein HWN66_04940 [Candidatus Helarchaeota archaeon]|nr:hypothetical protein [Candidatus Helarchaeota archaeon]